MPDWVTPVAIGASALVAFVTLLVGIGAVIWKGGRWTGQVDSTLTSLKTAVEDLRTSADGVRSALDDLLTSRSPAVEKGSPLGLSEYGKRLAEFLDAQDWAKSTTPEVVDRVRGMKPHEIEKFCEAYVETDLEAAVLALVDEATYEFGLSKKEILPVFWILLRDELLRLQREGQSG